MALPSTPEPSLRHPHDGHSLGQVARRAGVVFGVLALFILVWAARDVLLLIFAGILVGTLFLALRDLLADHTPLGKTTSLVIVLLLLVGIAVGSYFLVAPAVSAQVDELTIALPQAIDRLTAGMRETTWGSFVLQQFESFEVDATGGPQTLQRFTGVASTGLTAVTNLVVIFFLGLYFAIQPGVYRKGFLCLFPERRRDEMEELFDDLGLTLRGWLKGKILAMFLIGVLTWIGLWALGLPLPFLLALIAAILTFIPNFGPVLSAVPAVLLGLMESPQMGLWVVLLYIGIQVVESYLVTPLIQRKAVNLPPALILTSQVLLGVLLGFLGLALAVPIAAVTLVTVRHLWIEEALGEEVPDDVHA
jgi:predicted PurR-regulated permease PerM